MYENVSREHRVLMTISNSIKGAPQAFSYLTFSESVLLIEHRLSQDLTLSVSKEYIQRTPIVLVQMLAKLISSQNNNGSWGVDSDLETTTFAVLAIISISSLSYTHVLADEIQETLTKAGASLKLLRDNIPTPDEKANHSTIESITEAYSLVAMKRLQENGSTLFPINRDSVLATKVSRFAKWFSNTDYLNGEPSFMIKVSILEASFYRPILQDLRTKVFPQTNSKEGDKYMEYIPIMWVIPSTRRQLFLSPEYILDMLVLSMWIFLVDECMESNVIQFSANEFAQFRSTMGVHSAPDRGKENDLTVQSLTESPAIGKEPPLSHRLEAAISVFTRFIIDVLAYSHVENSSLSDRFELRLETVKYLLYHIEQLEENIRFSKQQHVPGRNTKFLTPRMPYHTWVHTVGAGHVSGPFAFAFLTCLLGGSVRKGRDCFGSVTQKLIAFKMNSHIGSFCRIYNDYGSVSRDREEFNINSINFPEFFPDHLENEAATHQGDKEAKKALLKAGVFERKCAIDTSQILCKDLEAEGEEGKRVSDAIQIYMGGCEQFSDMYLTRDVTNTVK